MTKKTKQETDIQILAEKFLRDPSNHNFEMLMKRCEGGLKSFIKGIVTTDDATDDVYSKVMEHVYYRRGTFKSDNSKFSTWLYTIAKNDSLKFLAHGYGDNKLDIIDGDINDSYYEYGFVSDDECSAYIEDEDSYFMNDMNILFDGNKFMTFENKEQVMSEMYDASVDCMMKLPDYLRVVMEERYINNKEVEDIAYDNDIPVSSVKNWLRKGKMVLGEEVRRNYSKLYKIYTEVA